MNASSFDPQIFADIAQKLSDLVPTDVKTIKTDLEQQFLSVLQATFAQLDLVTRQEFDTQTKVLARSRAKIEALEQQVAALEQQFQQANKSN